MTSRKNQQAARQYMREHDVPYMEALRRVTSQSTSAQPAQVHTIAGRPLSEPLILGYTPPRHEESKPSLLGRFRKKPQEDPTPVPYVVSTGGEDPRLVTVYGPPGTGKTMLLRSLLKQFHGHAAYVVHDGFLLSDAHRTWIEPWEGLTEVDLRPWLTGPASSQDLGAPTPPSVKDLPLGSLVVLDISGVRDQPREEESSFFDKRAVEAVRPWLEFEENLGRMARSRGITVATAVMTDSRRQDDLPLSLLPSPLEGPDTKVRLAQGYRPRAGGPWVYEAVSRFSPHSAEDYFTLTEDEARQIRVAPPRVGAF